MNAKLVVALSAVSLTSCATDATKPNIVFILVDDMGWRDLGCFGAELYETPNIDKLCSQGVKFNNAYTSAPISSPARASVLSGMHPTNLKMWNHMHCIPQGVPILPSYLKECGYQTWHVGKWHLGNPEEQTMPTDLGFDVNIGGGISWEAGTYFYPYNTQPDGTPDLPRASVPSLLDGGEKGEYLTDRLTDEALKLIDNADKDAPFYLNMWYYAVHSVLGKHESKPELVEKYKRKIEKMGITPTFRHDDATDYDLLTSESNAEYAAMIECVDNSVGRIVEELKRKGEYDNTLFIFYSDNGCVTNLVPCDPLMGGKNSTYEGGVRVPAFISWKGHTKRNKVSDQPIIIMDVFDTILEAAGATEQPSDGISLLPALRGEELPTRDFYWYFPDSRPHWGGRASMAYLDGESQTKYIRYFTGDKPEMYNITDDIAERNNLVEKDPKLAKDIESRMRAVLSERFSSIVKPPKKFAKNVHEFLAE